ncbi:MAG: hypothetical protein E8D46_03790 [Nitrospira sp.]|nr:MAG: hypothetical protein E8D46_03790 [Nitrospira sp.]
MPQIDDYDLPNNERPDLTPYLIHLTKGNDKHTGFEILQRILRGGVITGTDSYIKGNREAACFMDIPFASLKYVCSENNKRRYEPYGVIVKKTTAYDRGARPVLYLSSSECQDMGITKSKCPNDLWRVVSLKGSNKRGIWGVNWMHEREWRCPDEFELPSEVLAVLVKSSSEAEELSHKIARRPSQYKCRPKTVIPLNIICQGLVY